eukprot:jgi/Mesvir1/9741/Mv12205-RA.2
MASELGTRAAELQKRLGKKATFEEAASELASIIRSSADASPTDRDALYQAASRAFTLLQTRYGDQCVGLWRAGERTLAAAVELCSQNSEDDARRAHLRGCLARAREVLAEDEQLEPRAAATAISAANGASTRRAAPFLFEGQLSHPAPAAPLSAGLALPDLLTRWDVLPFPHAAEALLAAARQADGAGGGSMEGGDAGHRGDGGQPPPVPAGARPVADSGPPQSSGGTSMPSGAGRVIGGGVAGGGGDPAGGVDGGGNSGGDEVEGDGEGGQQASPQGQEPPAALHPAQAGLDTPRAPRMPRTTSPENSGGDARGGAGAGPHGGGGGVASLQDLLGRRQGEDDLTFERRIMDQLWAMVTQDVIGGNRHDGDSPGLHEAILQSLAAAQALGPQSRPAAKSEVRALRVVEVNDAFLAQLGRDENGAGPECAVCKEPFVVGDADVQQMPCNTRHIFHSACLAPWLVCGSSCRCGGSWGSLLVAVG